MMLDLDKRSVRNYVGGRMGEGSYGKYPSSLPSSIPFLPLLVELVAANQMAILELMTDSPVSTREFGFSRSTVGADAIGSKVKRAGFLPSPSSRLKDAVMATRSHNNILDFTIAEQTVTYNQCQPDSKKRKMADEEEKTDHERLDKSKWHPLFKQDTPKVVLLSNDNVKFCVDRAVLSSYRQVIQSPLHPWHISRSLPSSHPANWVQEG
jgi:hypothetical protein